jgi:hypothetical protein
VNAFQVTVDCLKAGIIHDTNNLEWCRENRGEGPPYTRNYLGRAGIQMGYRAVLRYIFDAAKEQDEKAGNRECQLRLKEE